MPEKVRALPAALAPSRADPAAVVRDRAPRNARIRREPGARLAIPLSWADRCAGEGGLRRRGFDIDPDARAVSLGPIVFCGRCISPHRTRRREGRGYGFRVFPGGPSRGL